MIALQDSPILSCVVFRERYLLTASMSGQLLVSDIDGNAFERRRDHSKYIVKITVHDSAENPLIATAGWDSKICIYKPSISDSGLSLGEPFATIELQTKPEAMAFIQHPEAALPVSYTHLTLPTKRIV